MARSKKSSHPGPRSKVAASPADPAVASRAGQVSASSLSRPVLLGIILCIWLAAFLRIWGAMDEFWMDEIWSLLLFAGRANSPLDIMTAHHDNNHYLVTLWMYLLGQNQSNWTLYRIPSIVAGIGTIVLAARFAWRWGTVATVVAIVLTSASYMLICFASEARGYALAGFFALAALLALDRFLANRSIVANILFVISTILGTLSHLTFVEVYFALFTWSCAVCWQQSKTRAEALRQLAWLHVLPILAMAVLYIIDIRAMKIGGGDTRTIEDVVISTLALTAGALTTNIFLQLSLGGLVFVAAIVAIVLLARENSTLWLFFASGIFFAPMLLLTLHPPELIYERYFYVNLVLLLVLFSYLFSRLWVLRPVGPIAVVAALALFVAANGWQTFDFLRVGRGHFRDALEFMLESDPDQKAIHIANDGHRSRPVLYTQFYGRYVAGHTFVFDDLGPNLKKFPEWMIIATGEQPYGDSRDLRFEGGNGYYRIQRVFPYAGISGFTIAVYRWQNDADARPAP